MVWVMRIIESLKMHWRVILITFLLMINSISSYVIVYIKNFVPSSIEISHLNISILFLYLLLEGSERISSNADIQDIKVDLNEGKESLKKMEKEVYETNELIKENEEIRNKRYEKAKLLSKLINENGSL